MLFAQVSAPVVQLTLLLTGFQPAALPDRIIAVLHEQRLKRQRFTGQQCVVAAQPFVDQHVHRPAIGDHVVQVEQQQVLLFGQTQHLHGEQRPTLQIEGLCALFGHGLPRTGPALFGRQGAQIGQADAHWRWRRNTLKRPVALLAESGAQAFMTCNQTVERSLERAVIQLAAQQQRHRHVVSTAGTRVEPVEEP